LGEFVDRDSGLDAADIGLGHDEFIERDVARGRERDFLCHGIFSATGAERLSLGYQPVTETRQSFSSHARLAGRYSLATQRGVSCARSSVNCAEGHACCARSSVNCAEGHACCATTEVVIVRVLADLNQGRDGRC
jgi:hypothetical protein